MSDGRVIEHSTLPTSRRLANVASAAALVLAGVAVAALVATVGLKSLWSALECGDGRTIALDRVFLAAIVTSGLAVSFGVAALISRTEIKARAVIAIATALVVALLIFIPDGPGGYRCMVFAV
ncbi:MAG TPA: hypothetical protein VIB62_10960 [Actinomycetota bacterium]